MKRSWARVLFIVVTAWICTWRTGITQAAPPPDPLPITAADPTWGDAEAPVTLVAFSDLECPFCDRVLATLHALRKDYGKKKLRVVHKHFPLGFHKQALRAAQVGAAIQTLHGSDAFFSYQDAVFQALRKHRDPLELAEEQGKDRAKIEALLASGKPKKKVEEDVALGKGAGVRGTPAFFINGVFLSGAKPKSEFAQLVDEQLAAAAALRKKGVPPAQLSARLTRENFAAKAGKPGSVVWKVPVAKSPVMGPRTALVTMVLFSDFQCPYCDKVMPTIAKLRQKYGKELRVAFKHNPLSFHKRADDAAQLALEAHAQKGDAAFWKAVDALFKSRSSLEDDDLALIATQVGLNADETLKAVRGEKHARLIEEDQLLARHVTATGTPTVYINGRKLSGAGDASRFEPLIDEELAKAKKLVKSGIPRSRVYAHIMKKAKGPKPPPLKSIPKVDAKTPVTGRRWAKVTIQVFADFESPFWVRAVPALRKIDKHYKHKVRIAFRHKPLPFHTNAHAAHEAAAEAFAQKGNAGFWKFHDLIVSNPHALDEETLLKHAAAIGMNTAKLEEAWKDERHHKRIAADEKLAADRQISSVPAFLVNGYYLNGAQSFVELAHVVDLALKKKP